MGGSDRSSRGVQQGVQQRSDRGRTGVRQGAAPRGCSVLLLAVSNGAHSFLGFVNALSHAPKNSK